jgi:hypothetical protein
MNVPRGEIVAVVLTGLGNLVVADALDLRLSYIVTACLLWTAYVLVRAASDRGILAAWGFRREGFRPSLAVLAPVAVGATLAQVGYGVLVGSPLWHWHLVPVLALYAFWGLVQQFLVVALVAGNLRRRGGLPDAAIVVATALLFAAVHAVSATLVVAAFLLAVVTTVVYFRHRNLWALGLFHGWFATGLYYLVLGEDPWRQVIAVGFW